MLIWLADALVIAGLIVLTFAVYGVMRLPDVYLRLHASSKAAFAGLVLLLLAGVFGGNEAVIGRTVLIVVLLAVTTPVAAHVTAQAALRHGEPIRAPRPVDESEPGPGPAGKRRPPGRGEAEAGAHEAGET